MLSRTILASSLLIGANGFAFVNNKASVSSALHMGLFDGVKEAFSAPALERSGVDSERETPIDRWMGWSVASENNSENASGKWICAPSCI